MKDIIVQCSDVLDFPCDVLVLKYAQDFYGADEIVASVLKNQSISPLPGRHVLLPSEGKLSATQVLFIGVAPLSEFGYPEIRQFATDALRILARETPDVTKIAMTVHGVTYGLDERESFLAQIAGLLEAFDNNITPSSLQQVTIVEKDQGRALRLKEILEKDLPSKLSVRGAFQQAGQERPTIDAGLLSSAKPHIFVAMPFDEEMEDVYNWGIQGPVNAAGYLCERVDMTTFTGDILDRVKDRIESAELVIADLTGANPNVYLEVGYAWGIR